MCACNNKYFHCLNQIYLSIIVIIIYCSVYVNCYNVDVVNFAKYSMEKRSMFGFTVALHKEGRSSW